MAIDPEITQRIFYKRILRTLRAWHSVTGKELLDDLLLYRQLGEQMAHDGSVEARRAVTNGVLLAAITKLAGSDKRGAKVLEMRFMDGEMLATVAQHVSTSVDHLNHVQRSAVETLVTILQQDEQMLHDSLRDTMEGRLPALDSRRLFGVASVMDVIGRKLTERGDAASPLVAICGLGGIGKTALANVIVRQLLPEGHFEEIVWLDVASEPFSGQPPAPDVVFEQLVADASRKLPGEAAQATHRARRDHVQHQLRSRRTLLVVDNLESKAATLAVIDGLQELLGPSRALLTTRHRPNIGGVFVVVLDELPEADALELLRFEAAQRNLQVNDDAVWRQIYGVTGGNPLALKLVLGMMPDVPLTVILTDLGDPQLRKTNALYNRIYRRAWRQLETDAQDLLLAMASVGPSGATWEWLQSICGMTRNQFSAALTDLTGRSLIINRGSAVAPTFAIHRLTEQFLRRHIIGGQEDGDGGDSAESPDSAP